MLPAVLLLLRVEGQWDSRLEPPRNADDWSARGSPRLLTTRDRHRTANIHDRLPPTKHSESCASTTTEFVSHQYLYGIGGGDDMSKRPPVTFLTLACG
ncbi:hypothetical protein CNECB9_4760008 [Cupriavidus necator]|uniref:Uncharacterized protein n=1 Tax=Cupriavidus necator TaxID=106590 RepID=A0A1K0IME1_CUPNE|nr:hypothetical protein CNECB9_4760008 [Cupriavidus necator]